MTLRMNHEMVLCRGLGGIVCEHYCAADALQTVARKVRECVHMCAAMAMNIQCMCLSNPQGRNVCFPCGVAGARVLGGSREGGHRPRGGGHLECAGGVRQIPQHPEARRDHRASGIVDGSACCFH